MITVDPSKRTIMLAQMFVPETPDRPRLFAVLGGRSPGLIAVDRVSSPTWCFVRCAWSGRVFLSGSPSRTAVIDIIDRFRGAGHVLLDLADPRVRLYPYRAAATEHRLEFCSRRSKDPAFTRLLNHMPGGCDVQAIDFESLSACQWKKDLLYVFGSAERLLQDSLGFGVFCGGVLVSEAHAFFWGGSLVEIGAITKEAYRGRGYATLAAAHLIAGCEEREYTTYWGCDVENPASAAVARRLGYGEPRAYTLEFYPAAEPL